MSSNHHHDNNDMNDDDNNSNSLSSNLRRLNEEYIQRIALSSTTNNSNKQQQQHQSATTLPLSPSTRYTYNDICNHGPEEYPIYNDPRDIPKNINYGISSPSISHSRLYIPPNIDVDINDYPPISLVRYHDPNNTNNTNNLNNLNNLVAYGIFEHQYISLNHHYPDWGNIYISVLVYPFYYYDNNTNIYYYHIPLQNTQNNTTQYVAIKKLNKRAIYEYLNASNNNDNNDTMFGKENPYIEIARMEEFGDNIHVLQYIDVIQDTTTPNDGYLYIILPQAISNTSHYYNTTKPGATLKDIILWNNQNQLYDITIIRTIFYQLILILLYLEKYHICHRDLSPDNFLFIKAKDTDTPSATCLVVFDLALSIRIPRTTSSTSYNNNHYNNHHRTLIKDNGNYGTIAWMSPEIFHRRIYDGVSVDIWSIIIILYNLCTNHILYIQPTPHDVLFLYYLIAKGLSSTPINEMTIDVLAQYHQHRNPNEMMLSSSQINHSNIMNIMPQQLLTRSMIHLSIHPMIIEIFENTILHVNPIQRYTLAQIYESHFIQYPLLYHNRNNHDD